MESKLKEIIADILDVHESEIHDDFSPENTPSWDSMNNLRMITAIEDEFNVKLSMEDIRKMSTFGRINETIARYLG